MVSLASVLTEGMHEKNYQTWGRPRIRAKLLDITKEKLEVDFVLEGHHRFHAWTEAVSTLLHPLPSIRELCVRSN